MPLFWVKVSEVRHYEVDYLVEADDPDEATGKAEEGDSIKEVELKNHGVLERHVHDEPEPATDEED